MSYQSSNNEQRQRIKSFSKKLSWLLRHGASQKNLPMDQAGWVEIDAVLRQLRMSRADLDQAVLHNNKSRLEVRGSQIRASQGHSLDAMPVTQEALEASWARYEGSEYLWHSTQPHLVDSIRAQGLLRGDRTHVHLASSRDSKVGKRVAPTMIQVSLSKLRAAGQEVFVSSNGVVLTRFVPATCITKVFEAPTRRRR